MRTRQLTFLIAAVAIWLAPAARGQSTISNDPYELDFGKGMWGVMLPSYELGTSSAGGFGIQDDLDDPGFFWQLKGIRRFLGTRTSAEVRTFYAAAGANSLRPEGNFDFLNPADGSAQSLTGGRGQLHSDVDHYGFDFALRDTWVTPVGGLSAGMTISYMAFDQEFESRYNTISLFEEQLESDFVGGKGFVGWDGYLFGYASNIDLLFGYYDVDAAYEFAGNTIGGSRSIERGDQSATVEIWATTRTEFNIGEVGLTLGAMYIDQMPRIIHNQGAATIGTDSAATLTAMVEWIF